jgi:phosphatidylinositol-3-phosphatase
MRLHLLRMGIIVTGAAAVLAIPATMVLGNRPATSTTARNASQVVERSRDDDERRAALANRVATATPAPAVTPGAAAPTSPALPSPATPLGAVPSFSHVFVIVLENHEYGTIIGSSAAPYINRLAAGNGLATNYYAASHPSLPNYLALTAGGTFGIASDCTTCFVNATNIADQLEASGRSWKAYMEDMPTPCYLGPWSGNYAMKHNPFMYFTDIRSSAARCAAHVVPFTQFSADMGRSQVPNFVWITPNMCNDMHDCGVATGDAWLANVVPTITASTAFRNGGVLFITWDEGSTNAGCCADSWGGHVATLVISSRSISGFRSGVAENHYSLLRTIEDAFQLAHLGAAGWSSNAAMREYFR